MNTIIIKEDVLVFIPLTKATAILGFTSHWETLLTKSLLPEKDATVTRNWLLQLLCILKPSLAQLDNLNLTDKDMNVEIDNLHLRKDYQFYFLYILTKEIRLSF